jgi:Protein of unknown function (DUF4232)
VFSVAALLVVAMPMCHTTQSSVMRDPRITPVTGQNPLAVQVMNRASRTCRLRGYPKVAFEDRAGRIPFVITHRGDQMVTNEPPVTVVLRPRAAAYVLLNHYRCDLGDRRIATILRIGASRLRLTDRYRRVRWCGKGDPGSTLAVSPFEPTLAATLHRG